MLNDDLRILDERTSKAAADILKQEFAMAQLKSDIGRMEDRISTGTGLSIEATLLGYKFRLETLESEKADRLEKSKYQQRQGKYSQWALWLGLFNAAVLVWKLFN